MIGAEFKGIPELFEVALAFVVEVKAGDALFLLFVSKNELKEKAELFPSLRGAFAVFTGLASLEVAAPLLGAASSSPPKPNKDDSEIVLPGLAWLTASIAAFASRSRA